MERKITLRDCYDVAENLGVQIVFNDSKPAIKEGI